MLKLASEIAVSDISKKNFYLGCVILRTDGAVVTAHNGKTEKPHPMKHAEARALKKADYGCTMYVARIAQGDWANARPCKKCELLIRNRGVKKVVYTISPNEYGIWYPMKEKLSK